uniref:Uncharacterized protein n=1 Tax=Sexangularia sp. CB-2014 TaxID=1486929 RepID=A0A7S1YFK9_9EUKA
MNIFSIGQLAFQLCVSILLVLYLSTKATSAGVRLGLFSLRSPSRLHTFHTTTLFETAILCNKQPVPKLPLTLLLCDIGSDCTAILGDLVTRHAPSSQLVCTYDRAGSGDSAVVYNASAPRGQLRELGNVTAFLDPVAIHLVGFGFGVAPVRRYESSLVVGRTCISEPAWGTDALATAYARLGEQATKLELATMFSLLRLGEYTGLYDATGLWGDADTSLLHAALNSQGYWRKTVEETAEAGYTEEDLPFACTRSLRAASTSPHRFLGLLEPVPLLEDATATVIPNTQAPLGVSGSPEAELAALASNIFT